METNPYASPKCMQEPVVPNLRWGITFKAWVAFVVLSIVGSFLVIFMVAVIVGAILGICGVPVEKIHLFGEAIGKAGFCIVPLPVSYLCFRYSVKSLILPRL